MGREHPPPEPGLARRHDETYKLIFSRRAAVEELVRSFVGEDLAGELDFDTLEAQPTDRISGGLVHRQVDLLWKIRFRGSWLYVLVFLEFQSESDHFMALRILTYVCPTYEELLRRRELKAGDKLPPVLPVTVYNGRATCRAETEIPELIAPVPPPLASCLPQARHLLLDLQRIGEQDPPSKDLVTSLGKMEREPSPENIQRVMKSITHDMSGPNRNPSISPSASLCHLGAEPVRPTSPGRPGTSHRNSPARSARRTVPPPRVDDSSVQRLIF